MRTIDLLDRKILVELETDARQSFRDIAKKLKVSIATVINRTKIMEKAGIIRGYSARLDSEKLGYDIVAIIEIVVSKGKLLEVEEKIAKMPQVHQVYDITGQTDAIIMAKFPDRKELSQFVKSLLSMPYVERTNTHVVLTAIKEDLRLFA